MRAEKINTFSTNLFRFLNFLFIIIAGSQYSGYSCKFCSKVLTTSQGIKHHEETVHLKRARFQCRMCESTFSSISNRSCHEKSSCRNRPGASNYDSSVGSWASAKHSQVTSWWSRGSRDGTGAPRQAGPGTSANHSWSNSN